jgi:hypothetical protein
MSNLWLQDLEDLDIPLPKALLQEQCNYLWEKTDGRVFGKVINDKRISESGFAYSLILTSTSTPNYKYTVLTLYHDIPVYPVNVFLDSDVVPELNNDFPSNGLCITCSSKDEFEKLLSRVLPSKKVTDVISTLLAFSYEEKPKALIF